MLLFLQRQNERYRRNAEERRRNGNSDPKAKARSI